MHECMNNENCIKIAIQNGTWLKGSCNNTLYKILISSLSSFKMKAYEENNAFLAMAMCRKLI